MKSLWNDKKWNESTMQPFGCSTTISIISNYTLTSGFAPTFGSTILTSSSTNLICGSISKGYIFDCSTFVAKIVSTSCSWIIYGFFSSWPPFLGSYGSFVCTSSFWIIPMGPASISSSWPNASILVGLPHTNSRKNF